jgi:uncharacterized membrane protein YraQ (UPF0718 family)
MTEKKLYNLSEIVDRMTNLLSMMILSTLIYVFNVVTIVYKTQPKNLDMSVLFMLGGGVIMIVCTTITISVLRTRMVKGFNELYGEDWYK